MLIQILLFLLLGIIAGTFTGLIPGIHVNLIGIFLISLASTNFFLAFNKIYFVVFIVAMAITHTFIDFIPSIFLGCPDTDTELSILPGHELLKKGQGYKAIVLTCYGSLAAIIIFILLIIPSIIIFPIINELIKNIIPYILIGTSIILILIERKKLSALFIFLLTGALGFCVLNLNSINQPLLPLLSGLFGSSMLINTIKNKTQIPPQEIVKPKIKIIRPLLGSIIASPLCGFLPGLGSGQAAIIGNIISKTNKEGFLFLIGATNTLVMGFSFIFLYLTSKTRTGAAVAIKEIIEIVSLKELIIILFIIPISGIISFYITIFFAKIFSKKITKINYTYLSIITLIILFITIFLISNFLGIIIFIISTITGIYCINTNIKRTNMMGCLLIPTILYYLI